MKATLTPEEIGMNGENVKIQAAVFEGSTGTKRPVTVRVYD